MREDDNDMPKAPTDKKQTTDLDEIDFSNLQVSQDNQKELLMDVTDTLVLPLMTDVTQHTEEKEEGYKLMEVERRLQEEEKDYELHKRIYIGQLGDEDKTGTELDYLGYTFWLKQKNIHELYRHIYTL